MALTTVKNLDLTSSVTGTLPTANGGTGATSFTSGKILQVLNVENDSTTTTTNSSLQDTALALNITPSATSSKIFIQIQPQLLAMSQTSAQAGLGFGISREIDNANNTTVFETKYSYDGMYVGGGGNSSDDIRGYPFVAHLDSPNTTGVCRYKFRIKAYNSDTAVFNEASGRSRMYLFEVGA